MALTPQSQDMALAAMRTGASPALAYLGGATPDLAWRWSVPPARYSRASKGGSRIHIRPMCAAEKMNLAGMRYVRAAPTCHCAAWDCLGPLGQRGLRQRECIGLGGPSHLPPSPSVMSSPVIRGLTPSRRGWRDNGHSLLVTCLPRTKPLYIHLTCPPALGFGHPKYHASQPINQTSIYNQVKQLKHLRPRPTPSQKLGQSAP